MENLATLQRKAWQYILGLCQEHDEKRIVVNGQLATVLQDLQEFELFCGQNVRPKSINKIADDRRNDVSGEMFQIGSIGDISIWYDPMLYWTDLCVRIDGRDDMKYDVAKHLCLGDNTMLL